MYKNPKQIIEQCERELRKNKMALETMVLSERMKQSIASDNARLEKIKAEAEKQMIEEQGK